MEPIEIKLGGKTYRGAVEAVNDSIPPTEPPDLPEPPDTSLPAPQWSDFQPAPDARTIHVANNGDNAAPGTQDKPKKTLAAAYEQVRSRAGDRILLKCGDRWNERLSIWKSGLDAEHPMIVGAYGEGPRPMLIDDEGLILFSGDGSVSNIAILGLHIKGENSELTAWGIKAKKQVRGLLLEDLYVEGFGQNIQLMGQSATEMIENVTLRACISVDPIAGHKSQCLYAAFYDGLVLDFNLLDFATPMTGNMAHAAYLQGNGTAFVSVHNNIFARAPGNSIQCRSGANVEENLSLDCGVHISVAGNGGVVLDNDCLVSRKPGWGMELAGKKHVVTGNFVGFKPTAISNEWAYTVKPETVCELMTFKRNTVMAWSGTPLKMQGSPQVSDIDQPEVLSTKAVRVSDYDKFLGGPGTIEHFLGECREQRRTNWRPEYTAAAYRAWRVKQ